MIFALIIIALALASDSIAHAFSGTATGAPLDKGLDVKTAAGVNSALTTTDAEKSKPENLLAYAAALAPTAPASAAALRTRATIITLAKTRGA